MSTTISNQLRDIPIERIECIYIPYTGQSLRDEQAKQFHATCGETEIIWSPAFKGWIDKCGDFQVKVKP